MINIGLSANYLYTQSSLLKQMFQRVSIETVKDITRQLMTSSFQNYCCENLYTGTNISEKLITPNFLNHTEDEGINFPRKVGVSDAYVKKGKAIPLQA